MKTLESQLSLLRLHVESLNRYTVRQVNEIMSILSQYLRGELPLWAWVDDAQECTVEDLLNELNLEP